MLGSSALPTFPIDVTPGQGINVTRKGSKFRFDLNDGTIRTSGSGSLFTAATAVGDATLKYGLGLVLLADRNFRGAPRIKVDDTAAKPWLDVAGQPLTRVREGWLYRLTFDPDLDAFRSDSPILFGNDDLAHAPAETLKGNKGEGNADLSTVEVRSLLAVDRLPNKTEAEMVAEGAISEALAQKATGADVAGIIAPLAARTGTVENAIETVTYQLSAVLAAQGGINPIKEQVAHRFFASMCPQNTLVAASNALAMGYTSLETDLQITSDGQVVLFHDDSLDSLTDGTGDLQTKTLAELKLVDAGVKFADGRYAKTRIPTLTEFLAHTKGRVRRFYPEIKRYRTLEDIALMVAPLVAAGVEDITDVASFSISELAYVRNTVGNKRLGLLLTQGGPDLTTSVLNNFKALGGRLNLCISYTWLLANPSIVTEIRSFGMDVLAYTIPNSIVIRDLANIGVYRIMSDRPFLPGDNNGNR